MTDRAKALLDQVDAAHDWACGQTYGGSGDSYASTDTCRICGLARRWDSGSRQNNTPASHTFTTARGETVTLRDAARLEC